jgi:hypothetical protein
MAFRFFPLFVSLAALAVAGCEVKAVPGPGLFAASPNRTGPILEPAHSEERVDGQAIVVFLDRSGGLFRFTVENLSGEFMSVDRDAVTLQTPEGAELRRLPGGAESSYSISPGKLHDVNLMFPVEEIQPGETVYVAFNDAVTVGGRRVGLAPFPFVAR